MFIAKWILIIFAFLPLIGLGEEVPSHEKQRYVAETPPIRVSGPKLPSSFTVQEQSFGSVTYYTSFKLVADGKELGTVERGGIGSLKRVNYTDSNGQLVALAKEYRGTHKSIVVFDADGKFIGSIRKNLIGSFTELYVQYEIYDKKGELLGKSNTVSLMSSDVKIYNLNGDQIMAIHRNLSNQFGLSSHQAVTLDPKNTIDTRILVMIPVFRILQRR